jgi:adenine-specific DNA-methyltransferase
MAFVVPAEIGHAPYAGPLMDYLVANFGSVQLVAIKDKIFPRLSEDCWLLLADGAGSRASAIRLSRVERFDPRATPPPVSEDISVEAWRIRWRRRLRPFLLPPRVRNLYERMAAEPDAVRLGQVAQVGIGYVSGANGFFHLRPSDVQRFAIPDEFLVPSIRNGRYLTGAVIDDADVERWVAKDEPVLLLRIPPRAQVPGAVRAYLDTAEGQRARASYKCRNRTPWYTVPDVRRPAFVLTYMSGKSPALAAILALDLRSGLFEDGGISEQGLSAAWNSPAGRLSCELEGHPLGGGMLKLEPGEARHVLLVPDAAVGRRDRVLLEEGIEVMQQWRHLA